MRKLFAVICIGAFAALALPASAQTTDVSSVAVAKVDYGSTALQTNAGAVCEMACPAVASVPAPSYSRIGTKPPIPAYTAVRLIWTPNVGFVPDKSIRS